MFRGSVKSTGSPLRSLVSPSLPHPASSCAIIFQLDSNKEYVYFSLPNIFLCPVQNNFGGVPAGNRLATCWMVRESNPPGGGRDFRTCPDRPWGPPNLLYNGYRFFPRDKEPWSRKSKSIIPLWAVRPLQRLRASTRVHFTFTLPESIM